MYHYVEVPRHMLQKGLIILRTKYMYGNFALTNYLLKSLKKNQQMHK